MANNGGHNLRPYPEYRESALRWLGTIPAHWRENRAKYFFREVDERSVTGQEELLSVSHVTGVFVANFTVSVPPADEQIKILRYIRGETAKFSESIQRAARGIELVQEYRTRLIADVGMGKVDVRHLAPDAVEEACEEPWKEAEDATEGVSMAETAMPLEEADDDSD